MLRDLLAPHLCSPDRRGLASADRPRARSSCSEVLRPMGEIAGLGAGRVPPCAPAAPAGVFSSSTSGRISTGNPVLEPAGGAGADLAQRPAEMAQGQQPDRHLQRRGRQQGHGQEAQRHGEQPVEVPDDRVDLLGRQGRGDPDRLRPASRRTGPAAPAPAPGRCLEPPSRDGAARRARGGPAPGASDWSQSERERSVCRRAPRICQ